MNLAQLAVVSVIQGLAELLPVSSSAHVIVAERLMGLDPASPALTFLLVMLHTGTTFAVILYFWRRWAALARSEAGGRLLQALVLATAATGVLGLVLKHLIEKVWLGGGAQAQVEQLFSNLPLMACSLLTGGLLIIWAGGRPEGGAPLRFGEAAKIGLVQALCLPFRGFSRSGATISTGLLCGVPRALSEDFSFALAVILTPPVVAREAWRLAKAAHAAGRPALDPHLYAPGFLGMVLSFLAGLAALRWLSDWLERGRWRWFGYYCLAASAGVLAVWRVLG